MRRLGRVTLWMAAVLLAAPAASAYDVKHTPGGKLMYHGTSSVTFVVNPSVDDAAEGGSAAAAAAVAAWNGIPYAPSMSSHVGNAAPEPTYDGVNTILYMPDGYEPAGDALAVTVTTVDDATGEILDTDIVINGRHRFAVLPAGAVAAEGTMQPTDGAGHGGDDDARHARFDLQHVLVHEVGHSLGLADVQDDSTDVMYAMSAPGSASGRAPTSDDAAGVESIYSQEDQGAPRTGCEASVAGRGRGRSLGAPGSWATLGFAGAAMVLVASRRRGARRSR